MDSMDNPAAKQRSMATRKRQQFIFHHEPDFCFQTANGNFCCFTHVFGTIHSKHVLHVRASLSEF